MGEVRQEAERGVLFQGRTPLAEVRVTGTDAEGRRESCSWFPPLYEREGEASRQVMTQKVYPGELWDSHFFVLDQARVALRGSL